MRKVNNQYIDRLVKKFISENISDKADDIMAQINELGGMDDNHPTLGNVNLSTMSDEEIENLLRQPIDSKDKSKRPSLSDLSKDLEDYDDEPIYEIELSESEVCECGPSSMVSEGMCMECGLPKMEEGIYDVAKPFGRKKQSFDYIEEIDDIEFDLDFEDEKEEDNSEFCRYQKNKINNGDLTPEEKKDFISRFNERCGESATKDLSSMKLNMNEKLHGKQHRLDKNKNGRLDKEDFEILRGGKKRHMDKSDMEEGNYFSGELEKAREEGKKTFRVGGKTLPVHETRVKESVKLTESEIVNLIENLVNEKETKNIKNLAKPKGMAEYERAYKGSGRENKDAISDTNKKMKEYIKYGSEGEYEPNPKNFPMSNRELKKSSIKGFNMSDEGEEFIDDYLRPGQENISYDEIHPSDEWMDEIIAGSSKTGNSDEYANSVKTDVNKKILKKQKAHKLDILSKKAANKSPQPIFTTKDKKPGYSDGDGVRLKTNESHNPKEERLINEEFSRIGELMSYNRKTQ